MLQTGRDLIEAIGNLDELSVPDIVERSGTSIGAFYRRFDSKDVFFDAVQDRVMKEGLGPGCARVSRTSPHGNRAMRGSSRKRSSRCICGRFAGIAGFTTPRCCECPRNKTTWDVVKGSKPRSAGSRGAAPLAAAIARERRARRAGARTDRFRGARRVATDPRHAGQHRAERSRAAVADQPTSRPVAEDPVFAEAWSWPKSEVRRVSAVFYHKNGIRIPFPIDIHCKEDTR